MRNRPLFWFFSLAYVLSWAAWAPAVLANLVFYGFGEEVGWRGFALPCLQGRSSALRASALLAIGWAGWHLPLFAFSPGLSGMGAGGVAGWLVSLLLGSIVLTWLFNSTGGSIAAVARC